MTAVVPVALGLALVLAVVLGRGPRVAIDEAWFVQVLLRLRRGDVLYRDVFFGVGPVAPWLGVLAFRIAGAEARVLRILDALYFALALAVSWWMIDLVGGGVVLFVGLVVASIGLSGPGWRVETYGELGRVFGLAVVACLLEWGGTTSPLWPALAGGAAALALLTKQNIGAVDLVGGGLLVLLIAPGPAPTVVFVAVAVAVAGLVLVPLGIDRSIGDYWRRAFRNKTTYLETGRLGVVTGIREAWPRGGHPARRLAWAVAVTGSYAGVVAAPAAAVVAAVVAAGEGSARLPAGAVGLVAALVLASALFRADLPHVQSVLPLALLAVALTTPLVEQRWGVDLGPALGVALVGAGLIGAAVPAEAEWRRRRAIVEHDPVPHLHGLPVPSRLAPDLAAGARALREATGGDVFVLRPDAGFWYVAGDLENPTPFDYPLASTFGPHGQQDVVDAIAAGRVRWVCFPGPTDGGLRPALLETYVTTEMVPVRETVAGTVLERR